MNTRQPFPWRLLWLDLLGSLLAAVGFMQLIATGMSAVPLSQVVVGLVLMVPLIRHLLSRGKPLANRGEQS